MVAVRRVVCALGCALGSSSAIACSDGGGGGPATPGADAGLPGVGGLGPAHFDEGDLDPPSHGGTITFQDIGAAGWYPSIRDPAVGPCDAFASDTCCLARHEVAGDGLAPWDEELSLTLRGPIRVKQLAVYQPTGDAAAWHLVSSWDDRAPAAAAGLAFDGNGAEDGFPGAVGTECLVNVSTARPFPCGPGSEPFCAASEPEYYGWGGSKLFVILARMPHAGEVLAGAACSDDTAGNWWDAPWIGLSHGELVRAGAFSSCQCYARNPAQWWLADGCGQFNVFEVVNDNNQFRNLDVFSNNFFGYGGYVGEGPCGADCDVSALAADVDLIDKGESVEAAAGAVARAGSGPGAAFRRPADGYRYFVVLLDVPTRTVQLAVVHPDAIPASLAPLLPQLPAELGRDAIDGVVGLRLPR